MKNKENKKENTNQSVFTKETLGVVFILFSALCLVMLITGDKVFGKLGTVIDAFLYGAFGKFAYAVSAAGVLYGVFAVVGRKPRVSLRVRVFVTLALICLAALFHVISVGDVSSYGEYLKKSYQMGAEGFSAASAGGVITGLYAYFFSRLTVAGGAVVAGLLAAICIYVVASDIYKEKKTADKRDGERFKGVFVEETPQTQTVQSGAENGLNPNADNGKPFSAAADGGALVNAGTAHKSSKLFVNAPEDFAFKTKRETKVKDAPAIKIDSAANGLTVGRVGVSYNDARIDDLEKKIEYIKTPAKINLDSVKESARAVSSANARQTGGVNVSDYIRDDGSVKNGETRAGNIPMYEHDGNRVIGNTDDATERSEEFGRRYASVSDEPVSAQSLKSATSAENLKDKSETVGVAQSAPENAAPAADNANDGARRAYPALTPDSARSFGTNAERLGDEKVNGDAQSGAEGESVSERKEESDGTVGFTSPRLNREEIRRKEIFSAPSDDGTEDKDGRAAESAPPSRITRDRNISEILFGKGDKSAASGAENGAGFESRAEKDGNAPRERQSFGANAFRDRERAAAVGNAAPAEEEKPQKKLPPVHVEYHNPPLDLLQTYAQSFDASEEDHEGKLETIKTTLEQFHINVEPHGYVQGPSITRYELNMPAGISVKNVLKYDDDLRMRLASRNGVRIEAPIPGKDLVGIEVANKHRVTVGLKEVLTGAAGRKSKKSELIFALGKDIVGNAIVDNLAKAPHILVAGATGSGKSVCLNVMIVSMIMRYSPEELRLILIDPKRVGFIAYEHLPHLMIDEIVTEPQRCLAVLSWAYNEMERRYKLFQESKDDQGVVSDIDAYNEFVERNLKGVAPKMPRIVIILDELADLMETCKKDMDSRIRALAQKARAAGVHLVLATQRPSVDIITGTIKANLPSRIALKVMNFADSNTILGEAGAEKLLGNGDMLYKNSAMPECERYQGAWISDKEIHNVVSYIIEHNEAYFDDELSEFLDKETRTKQEDTSVSDGGDADADELDELFLKALALAVNSGAVSISQLQRRFQIGYARAGGIVDKMERFGFVSGNEGSKARRVLITKDEYESRFGQIPDSF